MENSNAQYDAFYTTNEPLGIRFIAHGYDQAQPLAGPWTLRNRYQKPATREEIERVLTAPRPEGWGYKSATYLEPGEFASAIHKEHKRVWLAVYRIWSEDLAIARAKGRDRRIQQVLPELNEALEKLRLYHHISQEQADQLLAEKADETPSF